MNSPTIRHIVVHIQCGGITLKIVEEEKFPLENLPIQFLRYLNEENGIIIWDNHGLYRLIPTPIVQNAYSAYMAANKLEDGFSSHGIHAPAKLRVIFWDQGIPVSPEIARCLISTQDIDKPVESVSGPDTATNEQTGQPEFKSG